MYIINNIINLVINIYFNQKYKNIWYLIFRKFMYYCNLFKVIENIYRRIVKTYNFY